MEEWLSHEDSLHNPHHELFRENRGSQPGKSAHKTLRGLLGYAKRVFVFKVKSTGGYFTIMVPLCGHDYLKDLPQVKKQMCKSQKCPSMNPLTKRSSVKAKENGALGT